MSKLGPQVMNQTEAARGWARVASIVKAFDDPGVFDVGPDDAIRVFRAYVPDEQQGSISPETYVGR